MAGNKTRDGLKITDLVRSLLALPGIEIRQGSNHPYVASMAGHPQSCPIATSTHARRMVVPWIKRATSYENADKIYRSLRTGEWE